tara:strand:- start:981 stop:1682 length:702 start_codon:yes stop_codon:yes gene_type:complete
MSITADNRLKAIETRYAGCHFRSRLEARWAVVFDHLGVKWEYEPEGFQWEAQTIIRDTRTRFAHEGQLAGGKYLPDFLLPDLDAWFEVKGPKPTEEDYRLAGEFSWVQDRTHFLAWGQIPDPRNMDAYGYSGDTGPGGGGSRNIEVDGGSDFDYALCVCPWCDEVGFQYEGRGARIHGYKHHGLTTEQAWEAVRGRGFWRIDDKCYTANDPKILAAYTAARSARFEHGESGAT